MTAVFVLLTVIALLLAFGIGLISPLAWEAWHRIAARRRETAVQDAMDAATGEKEPERRRGGFDEGFENLMSFSVNGKTGFEHPGEADE